MTGVVSPLAAAAGGGGCHMWCGTSVVQGVVVARGRLREAAAATDTGGCAQGAGEMFRVTTIPAKVDQLKKTKDGDIDFSDDFFGKPAYLTVSGQLSGEAYACALGDIYTFGPTFRAENSQTTRHLAEFWMIEPEMAFADLAAVQANAEAYVKYVVKHVLDTCADDMHFFNDMYDKTLLERLTALVETPFARVTYSDAIDLLKDEIAKDRSKWQFPDVEFGTDLSTEHERWLAEAKFQAPTFVYNYPRAIKSFYMRDNDDGKTVAATDLLVPGIGELVGGSQVASAASPLPPVLPKPLADLLLCEHGVEACSRRPRDIDACCRPLRESSGRSVQTCCAKS